MAEVVGHFIDHSTVRLEKRSSGKGKIGGGDEEEGVETTRIVEEVNEYGSNGGDTFPCRCYSIDLLPTDSIGIPSIRSGWVTKSIVFELC